MDGSQSTDDDFWVWHQVKPTPIPYCYISDTIESTLRNACASWLYMRPTLILLIMVWPHDLFHHPTKSHIFCFVMLMPSWPRPLQHSSGVLLDKEKYERTNCRNLSNQIPVFYLALTSFVQMSTWSLSDTGCSCQQSLAVWLLGQSALKQNRNAHLLTTTKASPRYVMPS